MTPNATTRLFIDAASLIAAAGSPQGGSAFILGVCARGYLQAVASPDVLIEAERNILEKLPADAFARYHQLVMVTPLLLVSTPPEPTVRQYEAVFVEDAHVVAAALAAEADFPITHDRGLVARVTQAKLSVVALTPGDFLQTVLPQHPEYGQIRQQG